MTARRLSETSSRGSEIISHNNHHKINNNNNNNSNNNNNDNDNNNKVHYLYPFVELFNVCP